jgi:anti-sigma-K factor RskA
MMMNDAHIPEDDLVLFALQLLPEDRMRQAKRHVETCDLCRTEIAKLQGDLVAYSMTADVQAPPPESRERLLKQIAKEPRLAPPEPEPAPIAALPAVEDRREDRRHVSDRTVEEPFFPTRQTRGLHRSTPPDEPEERKRHEELRLPGRQSRGLHRNIPEDEPQEREEREARRRPSPLPWVLAWTGWAVAAGCSFVAGLQLHQRQQMQSSMAAQQAQIDETKHQAAHAQDALSTLTAANAMQMPLHATVAAKAATPAKPGVAAETSPEALVAYLAEKGALVFIGMHLDPAPAGKTYELWLIPADGRNPLPAGTFKPDAQGGASIVMPELPKGITAKGFGITVENEGGSDTPTMPILLANS